MFRIFTLSLTSQRLMLIGATGHAWKSSRLIGVCNHAARKVSSASDFDPFSQRSRLIREAGRQEPEDPRQSCIDHLRKMVCSCGIWGYKSPRYILRDLYFPVTPAYGITYGEDGELVQVAPVPSEQPLEVYVAANVLPWGVVLEAEYGYRASAALIDSLMIIKPEFSADIGLNRYRSQGRSVNLGPLTWSPRPDVRLDLGKVVRELSDTYDVPVHVVRAPEFFFNY